MFIVAEENSWPPPLNDSPGSTQGTEESFVMASEAKILQLIAQVASVYCRIDGELDLSNRDAIV